MFREQRLSERVYRSLNFISWSSATRILSNLFNYKLFEPLVVNKMNPSFLAPAVLAEMPSFEKLRSRGITAPSFSEAARWHRFVGAGAPLFSNYYRHDSRIDSEGDSEEEDRFYDALEELPEVEEWYSLGEFENVNLWRFDEIGKDWRHRATGMAKVLRSELDPKRVRVVMWRQKGGRVACNFRLFPGIKVVYFQRDARKVCWKCLDFSEEHLRSQVFVMRFPHRKQVGKTTTFNN